MGKKAAKVRELIESISEDAWLTPPLLQSLAEDLWACIWGDSTGELGSTLVTPDTRSRLQRAARAAGCWWVWTAKGEPRYVPLSVAERQLARVVRPLEQDEALRGLETLAGRLAGADREVVEWAIGRLRDHV